MIKVIAFIAVYNEGEIIEKCIENALEQGLYPIVINNGCTDGTMDIVKDMNIPIFNHFTEKYNIYEINKWSIARVKEMGCDWYVQKDADEIFETYDGKTIAEAVSEADKAGYNCMRFDMYEFWSTVDDDISIKDFTERMQYYSYYNDRHLKMIKNNTEITTSCSHQPEGVIKESPERLIFRHYKFISLEQGRQKVRNRLRRFYTTRGTNVQYNKFVDADDKYYILPKEVYSKLYKFDGTWVKDKVFDGWRGY